MSKPQNITPDDIASAIEEIDVQLSSNSDCRHGYRNEEWDERVNSLLDKRLTLTGMAIRRDW